MDGDGDEVGADRGTSRQRPTAPTLTSLSHKQKRYKKLGIANCHGFLGNCWLH